MNNPYFFTKNKILPAKPSITSLEIDNVNDAIKNGWGDKHSNYIKLLNEKLKTYFKNMESV